jgi:DivIVA domain-containing protein
VFWFMLIALVAVVAAVALAVLGDGGALRDSTPDRLQDRLPADRPVVRSDIDALRLPTAVRGYRMIDVDEVLDRLGAELAERDAYIAELTANLSGVEPTRLDNGGIAPEGGFPSMAKAEDEHGGHEGTGGAGE